ncbi:hypothetical protein [Bradyrhizobium diazoefficiens]|uniref:hypothetical protein n=1 Tax=Bradyrhizobium diazoefficiens TaxID=1355477 RepID=UPI0027299925|nr:hypothetical protein [Bradyrhizobium diazoefficiens]WLA68575.1 hypothetical protein QNN01_19095 [Bradyrhizobium diazoefficiens]
MPRVINAYDGNSGLGKTLADIGEATYGDQAQKEVYRQKAFGLKRENDNAEPLAAAVRAGNRNDIGYYGVLAGKTGQDAADYGRLSTANHASSFDDPRLAISMLGAGGSAASTAIGQRRSLDNAIATTGMNNAATLEAQRISSDRARDTQLAIDQRTLTPVLDANGVAHYVPKSQAAGGEAPMTTDNVVANILRRQAILAQPGQTSSDPLGNVDPRILKKAGLDLPEQTLIEPRTGQTAISRDGGRTAILPDGRTVSATGFQPVSTDAALVQARDNNVRSSASTPLVVGDPAKSQAAADAATTTGIGPKIATFFNEDLGALPAATSVLKAATGSSEIAPGVQRARSSQDIRNNQARAVLLSAPGRQTVQAQQWVNDLLPQGNALSNPETEAAKIPTIVKALQGDHEQIRQLVTDPNTVPAERTGLVQQLHQIENTIRMYTEPAASAATPAPAPTTTAGDPVAQARDAIARGADPTAVRRRLQQNGVDPAGLDAAPTRSAPAAGDAQPRRPAQVIQNGQTYSLQPDGSYR